MSIATVNGFTSGNSSNTSGDVQRLPNGNTVIANTSAGVILDVDASWNTVPTLKGTFGYADWWQTLHGPSADLRRTRVRVRQRVQSASGMWCPCVKQLESARR